MSNSDSTVPNPEPELNKPQGELTRGERNVIVCAWIWLLAGLPFVTDTGLSLCFAFPLILCGLVLGIVWMLMTLDKPSRCTVKSWLSAPFIGVFVVSMAMTDWPLHFRVMLSEGALQSNVDEFKVKDASVSTPRRIGLFRVERIKSSSGAVYFTTSSEGIDPTGIAFVPPERLPIIQRGIQNHPGRFRLTHLYGNWYRFHEKAQLF